MKPELRTFLRPYEAALRGHLRQRPPRSLQPALRLGRRAVKLGLGTLDVAQVHERALGAQALAIHAAGRQRTIEQAGTFFAEVILPMEETHRTALEANVRLKRLNSALSLRTRALTTSNRELRREIAKRKAVEQTLRRSKQETRRVLAQSRRLQEQLRHLSHHVLSVQEEERKRISHELHDVVAHVLSNINIGLAVLKTEATSNSKGITKHIERTQKLVEKSVDVVHRFAYDLRPAVLDHLGLIPALHSFMKNFTKETGIRVSLTAFAGVNELDSARRIVLYRVAQEALANVARHAEASRVDTSIERLPKAVRMEIKDDGKSFDVEQAMGAGKRKRMGLVGMRERVEMVGGVFSVESSPGRGTVVRAQIPFNGAKEPARP